MYSQLISYSQQEQQKVLDRGIPSQQEHTWQVRYKAKFEMLSHTVSYDHVKSNFELK